MTPERLAEIEARLAAVTPGPWEREHGIIWGDSGREKVVYSGALTHDIETLEFIAAAPANIADLLAEVKRLQADVNGDSWRRCLRGP